MNDWEMSNTEWHRAMAARETDPQRREALEYVADWWAAIETPAHVRRKRLKAEMRALYEAGDRTAAAATAAVLLAEEAGKP